MRKEDKIGLKQRLFKYLLARSNKGIVFFSFLMITLLSFAKPSIIEQMELKAYDLRFASRPVQKGHPHVALAFIDEKSLDAEGKWPWPRSKIAHLVETLGRNGTRVIGFDIGFFEPEKNLVGDFVTQLDQRLAELQIENAGLDHFLFKTREAFDNDQIFANAIKQCPSAVVLGYFFHMPGADPASDGSGDRKEFTAMGSSRYPSIRFTGAGEANPWFVKARFPEWNLDVLTEATPYSGYFNVAADSDGVVRRLPLIIQYREDIFPPLSLLCSWLYLDRPEIHVNLDEYGVRSVFLGQREIPTDEYGQVLVNYPGPFGSFPSYSVTDILQGKIEPATFKDKVVIVGVSASGLNDNRTTPFGPDHPGVEIHAALISNILTHSFLTRSKWTLVFDLISVMGVTLILGFAIPRLNALTGFGFAALVFVFQIMGSHLAFSKFNTWINVVYPLLAVLLTYTLLTLNRYFTETRERKKIQKIFSQYASPDMVDEMVKYPEKVKLGGEVRDISVLFCDLANFSSISEKRTPDEMVDIMSRYFKEMTEYVYLHKGTLKEYVGDELMAIYGAPLFQEAHALNACRTALAMQRHLKACREKTAETGGPSLYARIGINTGEMLVGNLGSEYRFSYGALGDNVNLGSRLEGLNKIYGTKIIVGNNTYQQGKDHFRFRKLGVVRVQGRRTPEPIFELIGDMNEELSRDHEAALACYDAGYKAYLARNWPEAVRQFQLGLEFRPEDKSFTVMQKRCQMFLRTPPPGDWDGVFSEQKG